MKISQSFRCWITQGLWLEVGNKTVQNRYRQWCFPHCVANFWSPPPHWKRKIKERGKFQQAKIGCTTVPLTFFRPDAYSVRISRSSTGALIGGTVNWNQQIKPTPLLVIEGRGKPERPDSSPSLGSNQGHWHWWEASARTTTPSV